MADDDDLCECVCNHSGACTGCGICWLKAYYEDHERQIRAFFGIPPSPTHPRHG
jgi:hypothetical protein